MSCERGIRSIPYSHNKRVVGGSLDHTTYKEISDLAKRYGVSRALLVSEAVAFMLAREKATGSNRLGD